MNIEKGNGVTLLPTLEQDKKICPVLDRSSEANGFGQLLILITTIF